MVTVRDGDTIYALAARYGVPPTSIISDNQIGPPYTVFGGQRLRITPQRTHVVGPEDTIYSISQLVGGLIIGKLGDRRLGRKRVLLFPPSLLWWNSFPPFPPPFSSEDCSPPPFSWGDCR